MLARCMYIRPLHGVGAAKEHVHGRWSNHDLYQWKRVKEEVPMECVHPSITDGSMTFRIGAQQPHPLTVVRELHPLSRTVIRTPFEAWHLSLLDIAAGKAVSRCSPTILWHIPVFWISKHLHHHSIHLACTGILNPSCQKKRRE
jgi:hypothetical protein